MYVCYYVHLNTLCQINGGCHIFNIKFTILPFKNKCTPIYSNNIWKAFLSLICYLYKSDFFNSILSATNWIGLRKLEELDVSDNCLTSLPMALMHCLKSLSFLSVCRNKLSTFPDPWACPLVRNQTDNDPLPVCYLLILEDFSLNQNRILQLLLSMFDILAITVWSSFDIF